MSTKTTAADFTPWTIEIEDGDFSSTPSGAKSYLVVEPSERRLYAFRTIGAGEDGAVYARKAIKLDVPPDTVELDVRVYLSGANTVLNQLKAAWEAGDCAAVWSLQVGLEREIAESPVRWSAADWIGEEIENVIAKVRAHGSITEAARKEVEEASHQGYAIGEADMDQFFREVILEFDASSLDDDDAKEWMVSFREGLS